MTNAAATKAPKQKAISLEQLKEAETFGRAWLQAREAKAKADADMKTQATMLETFAKKNRAAFGDLGTLKVGNVKLKFGNAGKVKTDIEFDELAFAQNYPELVNISVSVAAMKGYLVNDELKDDMAGLGVTYITEEKFSIEKA